MMDQKTYIPESTEAELTRINEDMDIANAHLVQIYFSDFRLFLFKLSCSLLFSCSLFFIADVSHNYEWSLDPYVSTTYWSKFSFSIMRFAHPKLSCHIILWNMLQIIWYCYPFFMPSFNMPFFLKLFDIHFFT